MPTSYDYAVRSIHGAAKLESELGGLSTEGWEPVSFQHDAAGNFEVILRRQQNGRTIESDGRPSETIEPRETGIARPSAARYCVRTIRVPKLESDLTALSSDGWNPMSFQHDAAGAYEIILCAEPNPDGREATFYRYTLRSIHGSAKLESELSVLSSEGWEIVRLHRDSAGNYEVIVRQAQARTAAP